MTKDSLTRRILEAATGGPVAEGAIVSVPVDRIMAHDGSTPVVAATLERYGITELRGAERMVVVFDHFFPATTEQEANLHTKSRQFAAKYGIPVFSGEGICHHVLANRGLVMPGGVLVGGDSHTCINGAFGCLAIGLGATDVAGCLASGHLWLQMPDVVAVRLSGCLPAGVMAQDIALAVMERLTVRGALGQVIEFHGPGVAGLSMAQRMTISGFAVEAGALSGLFACDDTCRIWLAERGADLDRAAVVSPLPGDVSADVEIDLSRLVPVVAISPSPDKVVSLANATPEPVHQAFIGSCVGGHFADLQAAAAVLHGGRIAPGIRLFVAPSSDAALKAALSAGVVATLVEAGAVILPPGCGACLGRYGTLGEAETCLSTQNRNFIGRAGAKTARLHLASPVTVARAALTGTIPSVRGAS